MIAAYTAGKQGARSAARDASAVVVVGAIRASTTIALLVSKGARVIPVASVEEAASYVGADYHIGERGSAKAEEGFDFGNSPTEIKASELISDATVVLSTTNGTQIIEATRGAPPYPDRCLRERSRRRRCISNRRLGGAGDDDRLRLGGKPGLRG